MRKLINKDDIDDVRRELCGAYEDRHFVNLIMELCAGTELFDRIIAKVHYSDCAVAGLCQQMVSVVHDCHTMGVFHRDFKAGNFFSLSTDEDSPLKATEFGLSVFFKPGDVLRDVVGSVYYVAPEVLRRHYGAEADIWSTGVILYILLSSVQLSNFFFCKFAERHGWDYTRYNLFYSFVLVIIFAFEHFNFPNFVLQLVY
ncbi:unnamed protein product [Lactuca saligna]|uniref:Protein kinase domain-containing protein n=1 Tax=Lactuca saligna TaxID=75948 RepID=A0AA35VZE4_LACSI|nr:unnamed protein product [Lactuca saligna]